MVESGSTDEQIPWVTIADPSFHKIKSEELRSHNVSVMLSFCDEH
jgi:hypothetical protein